MEHCKRFTVVVGDVLFGKDALVLSETTLGEKQNSFNERFQYSGEKNVLRRTDMKGVIRSICSDFRADVRWTNKAIDEVHNAAERFLATVFSTCETPREEYFKRGRLFEGEGIDSESEYEDESGVDEE
jgi:histone H3/H4